MDDKTKEAVERVKGLAKWAADVDHQMVLSASVALEHADDLRTLLSALEEQDRDLQEAAKVVEPFALLRDPFDGEDFRVILVRHETSGQTKMPGPKWSEFRALSAFLTRINPKGTGHE